METAHLSPLLSLYFQVRLQNLVAGKFIALPLLSRQGGCCAAARSHGGGGVGQGVVAGSHGGGRGGGVLHGSHGDGGEEGADWKCAVGVG